MNTMRVNVIGAGHWGPNVIRYFHSSSECELGLVCDLKEERLEQVQKRFPGVGVTTSSDEAINDAGVQAIAIIAPVAAHYGLVKQALEAGKDVFVEKPLASTVEEAEELLKLSIDNDCILMVGHVFEFNSGIRKVKELIQNNEMGKLISIHAERTNLGPVRDDVNAMWDLGAHDLSIVNYWLEAEPIEVSASGVCQLSKNNEDTVMTTCKYPDDIFATMHVSWLHPKKVRRITLVGEKKMVIWNDMEINRPIMIFDKGFDVDGEPGFVDSFSAFQLSVREGDITLPMIPVAEPLGTELAHFVDCCKHRTKPLVDGESGLRVVRALEATDQSIKENSKFVNLK